MLYLLSDTLYILYLYTLATYLVVSYSRYTSICLTKLDILDTLLEIKVCVGYRLNGKDIDYFPGSTWELAKIETVYKTVEGWQSTTEGVRSLDKLPPNAHKYIQIIEEYLDVPGTYHTYVYYSL